MACELCIIYFLFLVFFIKSHFLCRKAMKRSNSVTLRCETSSQEELKDLTKRRNSKKGKKSKSTAGNIPFPCVPNCSLSSFNLRPCCGSNDVIFIKVQVVLKELWSRFPPRSPLGALVQVIETFSGSFTLHFTLLHLPT